MSLTKLPQDLLQAIICPENVDHEDLINLRLTCHALKDVSTLVLFHRIYISQLTHDRDTFLAISNSDLATHVVEIEWQEVSWHEGYFLKVPAGVPLRMSPDFDPDTEDFCNKLESMAASIFWLQIPFKSPPQPAQGEDETSQEDEDEASQEDKNKTSPEDENKTSPEDKNGTSSEDENEASPEDEDEASPEDENEAPAEDKARQQRKRAIHVFRKVFNSALKRFPNLRTIVSRPMPFDRVIYVPGAFDYPITAKLFQTHHQWNSDWITPSRKHGNDGLFKFILPAMEDNLVPSVTRLLWEDEFPGGSQFRRARPKAFAQLESLSLYLISDTRKDYDNLVANLDGASNVRHLSLMVQEPHRKLFSAQKLEKAMLRITSKGGPSRWTNLQSLSIVSMDTLEHRLVDLVANNADSLRHIYLRNSPIQYATIKALAKIPRLRLKTICLTEDSYDWLWSGGGEKRKRKVFPEADLLDEINREVPGGVQSEAVRKRWGDDIVILTEEEKGTEYPCNSHRDDVWTSHLHPSIRFEDEDKSVCSQDSEDSLDRRVRTGPKWTWSRFFHESPNGDVYYQQVPDSDTRGTPTVLWRFTYRDGTVNFGVDPLMWFDDWDPEAGDVEEPTPFGQPFLDFLRSDACERDREPISLESFLGQGEALELLRNLRPPEGAVLHCEDMDELWASYSWPLHEGKITPPQGAEFY